MVELYGARYISLHVRETNFAAFHLYRDTLKFEVRGTEAKYYADGENAFDMRKQLTREQFGLPPLPVAAVAAAPALAAGGGAGKRGRAPQAGGGGGGSLLVDAAEGGSAEAVAEAAAGGAGDLEPGARDIAAATAAMASAKIKPAVIEELD
jgi:hypothetical protein